MILYVSNIFTCRSFFIYYIIFINLTLVNNNIRNTHLQNVIKSIFSVSNLDNRAI